MIILGALIPFKPFLESRLLDRGIHNKYRKDWKLYSQSSELAHGGLPIESHNSTKPSAAAD